jgi:PPOX class probable F420-dependent enzyme
MSQEVARIGSSRYIRLTTFKKDGTAMPTPVWVVDDGERVYVTTLESAGKLKRIRNSGRVLVAPSDWRGTPNGEEVEGQAELLDAPGAARVQVMIKAKYGLEYRFFTLMGRLRRTSGDSVGIAIAL